MGFLDRLHNSINAIGSAGEDFGGFFSDLATAPWNDKLNGNPLTVLYQDTVRRGGGLLSDLIGPSGLGGTIAGGLPSVVRRPIRDVVNPVQDALSTAYTDAISHPAAAAITASSLADAPERGGHGENGFLSTFQDLPNLFRPKNWQDAWQMTQHESPGQAFALAAQTKDILNPTEVSAAKRSDNYRTMSGVFDAVMQMENPLNDAQTGLASTLKETEVGAHLGTIGSAITAHANLANHPLLNRLVAPDVNGNLDKLVNSGRLEDFAGRIAGQSAAQIKDTYFAKHPLGSQISSLLEHADQTGETVPALRVLLGHGDEIDQLAQRQAELSAQIDRLQSGRAAFEPRKLFTADNPAPWGADDLNNPINPSVVTDPFTRELAATKELYDEGTQVSRLQAAQGALQAFPTKLTLATQEAKSAAEDWMQNGRYSTVLHVIHNMDPHAYINFDAADSDVQLTRMLARSDIPADEQLAIRSKYMGAATSSDRATLFDQATNRAIESIGATHGLADWQTDALVQRSQAGRAYAGDLLKQREFDSEGRGSLLFRGEAGEVTKTHLPLWATQGVQMAPVTDMNKVRDAVAPMGALAKRFAHVSDIPKEALTAFDHIWRPAVLLTPGGTIRRVGDEVLRATAKFGVLAQMKHLEEGAANSFRKHFGDEAPGTHALEVLGEKLQGPMGAPGDSGDLMRALNSSGASVQQMLGKDEEGVMRNLEPSGSFSDSILPDDPQHGAAWERAVNRQIGQDSIGKRLIQAQLDGATSTGAGTSAASQVYKWLTGTPEGRYAGQLLPAPRRYWLDNLKNGSDQIDRYLPTDELKVAALKGMATKAMLDDQVERAVQPVVHGEVLAQTLGRSQSSLAMRRFTDGMFDKLATKPTDLLSRNPTFSEFYTREVQRRVLLADGQGQTVDDALKSQIEQQSRRWALGKTKSLMHDYTEHSQLGDMLRFTVPFWGAYAQHASRWAGILAEDPAWVRKLQLTWQAPNKAGWVVDQNGNTIGADGKITEAVPGGGYKVGDKGGSEQFLTLTVPTTLRKYIPGLRTGGQMELGKSGLNLLTKGLPTFGPFAQLPLNAIAKERPDLAQSMKWALPYGPNQSTLSTLFPATAQHFANAEEENSQLFTNTRVRIYHDDLVKYNLKYKSEMPDQVDMSKLWDSSAAQARAFMSMHNAASFVLPSSVLIGSPYQKYIDAYRSRLQYDSQLSAAQKNLPGYQAPADWFLNTFGPEFFPLTQSLSKSNNGVPPTLEAFDAQTKDPALAKLIADNPAYGSLVLGASGAGQFNKAVYDYQFAHKVGDQSGLNQRASATPTQARTQPEVELGWSEYSKINDAITTGLSAAGIPNINDKRAAGVLQLRTNLIAQLAQKFPDWYEAYSQSDSLSNEKKIIALTHIASSAPMQAPARYDMAGLRDYLSLRKTFTDALASTPAATLTANSNAELRNVWETAVQALVERNPAFGALYSRFLSTDSIAALTLPEQAYEQAVA